MSWASVATDEFNVSRQSRRDDEPSEGNDQRREVAQRTIIETVERR